MVDHALLYRELSRFAESLKADFDVEEALHSLCVASAQALGVDGTGVALSMPHGRTQYITATDATTMHVERCQDELHEGVCLTAIDSAQVVAVDDLTVDERWPAYRPMVLDAGFSSAAGVPIGFRGEMIGALNLYAVASRAWTTEELDAAKMVANVAAGYLVNGRLLRDAETLADQLQQALDSRVVIEQAKGILSERYRMTPDAAFEVVRGYARSRRTNIHAVAKEVVFGKADPLGADGARVSQDAGDRA